MNYEKIKKIVDDITKAEQFILSKKSELAKLGGGAPKVTTKKYKWSYYSRQKMAESMRKSWERRKNGTHQPTEVQ